MYFDDSKDYLANSRNKKGSFGDYWNYQTETGRALKRQLYQAIGECFKQLSTKARIKGGDAYESLKKSFPK